MTHAAKPGTRGIREAMARYGAAPQQTALVGDQIYTDVLGRKARRDHGDRRAIHS